MGTDEPASREALICSSKNHPAATCHPAREPLLTVCMYVDPFLPVGDNCGLLLHLSSIFSHAKQANPSPWCPLCLHHRSGAKDHVRSVSLSLLSVLFPFPFSTHSFIHLGMMFSHSH